MTPERNPTIAELFAVPEIPPREDEDRGHSARPGEAAGIMRRYREAVKKRRKLANRPTEEN